MRIGIIAALACELDILKKSLEDIKTEHCAMTEYITGRIGDTEVVLTQCGMGKVSAAAGTQAMITIYKPDYVINTGCAGALSEKLRVGEFVIADETVQWDLDTISLGNPRGYVSAFDMVEIPADRELTDMIAGIIGAEEVCERGMVVSGDQFVDRDEQKKIIYESFPNALCAEMEGAAVGLVCFQNQVPYAVVRCMSDNANGDSGVNFAEFSVVAGEKSAHYILRFLREFKG